MTMGKAKGSSFERKIARELSLLLTNGKYDDMLWRTAGSGAMATTRFKSGKGDIHMQMSGDLTATQNANDYVKFFISRYFIECKFFKKLNLERLFNDAQDYGGLKGQWAKALTDSRRFKKIPIMIAKQNNYPPLLITTQRAGDKITGGREGELLVGSFIAYFVEYDMAIFNFDTFKEEFKNIRVFK